MTPKSQSTITGINFPLKAYSVKQLADLYGVTTKTFRRWTAPFNEAIGDRHGHFYNIIQVKCIIQNLGVPGDVIVE